MIFCSRSHFLPVDCRKSPNNLFSIFRRSISYACSATTSLGSASLRGRPFGRGIIPAARFASFLRSRLSNLRTTSLLENLKYSAISRCVFPASTIAQISGSNLWVWRITPFVYCPFFMGLCTYHSTLMLILRLCEINRFHCTRNSAVFIYFIQSYSSFSNSYPSY